MKKKVSFLAALFLFGSVSALAQTPKEPTPAIPKFGPVRLGFINLERALAEVQEGKQLFGELQAYIDAKNKELEAQRSEIASKRQQFQTQEKTLSADMRQELQKELDERQTKLTRFQEDTSKEIERRQGVNVQKIGKKMQPLIQAYAKELNLTAVMIWSPQLYAFVDESVNVTNEIIKRYDAANPTPAGNTPAKPKTP